MKIANKYDFQLYISEESFTWAKALKKYNGMYDIILTGEAFTESFNRLSAYRRSERQRDDDVKKHLACAKKYGYYTPISNKKILKELREVPMYYRIFSIIQKECIRYLYPDLLKFTHVKTRIKHDLYSLLYRTVLRLGLL